MKLTRGIINVKRNIIQKDTLVRSRYVPISPYKKRHVKCDETRPSCDNCLESRGACEGYVIIPRKKPSSPFQVRWDSRQLVRSVSPPMMAGGYSIFQEFVELSSGHWITAVGCNDLWTLLTSLPRLAFSECTIRSAAIAVGALSLWHRQSAQESLRVIDGPTAPKVERDTYHFYAIACYCRPFKAALTYINHGLSMLLELLTGEELERRVAEPSLAPTPLIEVISSIYIPLAMQSRTVLNGKNGDGPSLPSLAKGLRNIGKTMESFMVLLSRLTRPRASMYHIPAVFNDLNEFEEWCECLPSKDDEIVEKFYSALLSNGQFTEFSANYGKVLQKLDAAFRYLFDRILTFDAESPECLKAIYLRLEYVGVYIFGNAPQFLEIETLQARPPLFREYLALAEVALRIIKHDIKNLAHRFSLHCNVSWVLLITSMFSRDPLSREKAVALNTRSLYFLALRNRKVERINATGGAPPEQLQHLWRREFVFENGADRILFRYFDKDEVAGGWQLIEETAEVRGKSDDIDWKRQPPATPNWIGRSSDKGLLYGTSRCEDTCRNYLNTWASECDMRRVMRAWRPGRRCDSRWRYCGAPRLKPDLNKKVNT
ncbi:hypothetical protein GGR53DRAFT_520378 [Hypoxylon sp. FL1150]|nr:hypothetical protein GGR53DRAFT_520378 [Hypoxylon sp. FL1150]